MLQIVKVMLILRRATLEDLDAITEIYNDAILRTDATFDIKPKSLKEQKTWFTNHGPKYPVLVAEENRLVIGWASLSPWSDRCAYSNTAEISIYVHSEHRGGGIGGKLIQVLIGEGEKAGLHTIIARITAGNKVSLSLHEAAGFRRIGTMREVGNKFGRLLDVHLLQFIYGDKAQSQS